MGINNHNTIDFSALVQIVFNPYLFNDTFEVCKSYPSEISTERLPPDINDKYKVLKKKREIEDSEELVFDRN